MAEFDIAVIGAGAAGLSVAAVAAQLGLRVALIERGQMGGDCLNTGCVPSKSLLAASHAAMDARAARRFGVFVDEPRIDWAAVQKRVRSVVDAIAPMDSEERFAGLGATVLRGGARFIASDTLEVALPGGQRRVTARRIVIAAGSRAAVPDLPGLDAVPYLTNETLFEVAERPEHLLILGGGAIGLEMAQAHAGLGCRVTIVESSSIAGREDPDLAAVLRAQLVGMGVSLHENARVVAVESGPALLLEDGSRISGSHLLIAVGRRPNTEDLGLDAAGIAYGPRGVATDTSLRCIGRRRVFAIGDIADPKGLGPRYLTHVGGYHASVVIRRALFRMPARLDYGALPRVTYTVPELAQVGMTEAEAREAGHDPIVMKHNYSANDRARTESETDGLAKLVVTKRGRILGVGIVAPHAGEMIGAWTLAISRRIPLSAMAGMIVPYPTLSEAPRRAAGDFFTPKLFANRTKKLVRVLLRLP